VAGSDSGHTGCPALYAMVKRSGHRPPGFVATTHYTGHNIAGCRSAWSRMRKAAAAAGSVACEGEFCSSLASCCCGASQSRPESLRFIVFGFAPVPLIAASSRDCGKLTTARFLPDTPVKFMSLTNECVLNTTHIRRRFDRAASLYSGADFVQRHAADGLLQRSLPIDMQPGRILDLGSALGAGSKQLAKRFRRARVVSIDTSARMLEGARDERGWFSKVREVQADVRRLPLPSASVDLVFANMLLPFINDVGGCLGEVARVLRKDGVFLFSSLGPASLSELRAAWAGIDDGLHVRDFADMHILGGAVVAAGLRDPVLDVDNLCVTYRDTDALFRDLTAAGARNSLQARRQSLTGKGRLAQFRERLGGNRQNGLLRLNLELVYGHAWGGGAVPVSGEFHLAPGDIGRRRR